MGSSVSENYENVIGEMSKLHQYYKMKLKVIDDVETYATEIHVKEHLDKIMK